MNLIMIIDQYIHDQSHDFCRYLAANDGDWLERDFPKDVIPVCGKKQQELWLNVDMAEKIHEITNCQKVLECSARENCHIKELFQTLFSLSGLPRIIERYRPKLEKYRIKIIFMEIKQKYITHKKC